MSKLRYSNDLTQVDFTNTSTLAVGESCITTNETVDSVEVLFTSGLTFNELHLYFYKALKRIYIDQNGHVLDTEMVQELRDRGVKILLSNESDFYELVYEGPEGGYFSVQKSYLQNTASLFAEGEMWLTGHNPNKTRMCVEGIAPNELSPLLKDQNGVCHNQGYEKYAPDVISIRVEGVSAFTSDIDWTLFDRANDLSLIDNEFIIDCTTLPKNLKRISVVNTTLINISALLDMSCLEEVVFDTNYDKLDIITLLEGVSGRETKLRVTFTGSCN